MTEAPAAATTSEPTKEHEEHREHEEQPERDVAAAAPAGSEDLAPTESTQATPIEEPTPPTRPTEPIVDAPEPPVSEQHAVVALPGTHRQEPRPSLWRRIALRSGVSGDAGNERLLARLDVIEARVSAAELSLGNRIQALDDRFTEVWEVEEQLSQISDLRAALAEISTGQRQLDERLGAMSGKLTLVTVVIGAAVVAGVIAMVVG